MTIGTVRYTVEIYRDGEYVGIVDTPMDIDETEARRYADLYEKEYPGSETRIQKAVLVEEPDEIDLAHPFDGFKWERAYVER